MEKDTFTEQELQIMQFFIDRAHTDNAMSGKGNSREMNALLRKLNTLTDNEAANNE